VLKPIRNPTQIISTMCLTLGVSRSRTSLSSRVVTNMTLSGFSGKASDVRGIISMELTMGSKTVPTAFFEVNVTGKYYILLGQDWIHANGCVPLTLHQCGIQWIGDQVEAVAVDDSACIAMAETQGDLQDGEIRCLSGRDLSDFDLVSMGSRGFVLVNVKPVAINQLINIQGHDDE
jgi:hypothetical protein